MNAEVVIAGYSKRILVRIPPSAYSHSGAMLGIPSPRVIQLDGSSYFDNVDIPNYKSSLPTSNCHKHISSSTSLGNAKIVEGEEGVEDSTSNIPTQVHQHSPVLQSCQNILPSSKSNIQEDTVLKPLSDNTHGSNESISTNNLFPTSDNQKSCSPAESSQCNQCSSVLRPTQKCQKVEENNGSKNKNVSKTSKLIAKRIVYLADTAIAELFGPLENLSPEYIPHARQLRQQLLVTLAAVVREHVQQKHKLAATTTGTTSTTTSSTTTTVATTTSNNTSNPSSPSTSPKRTSALEQTQNFPIENINPETRIPQLAQTRVR